MAISPQDNGLPDLSQPKLMADINVTPMVDVMLVLLIIFMVTAPLLVAGMPVELPRTSAQPIAQPKKPVVVTLAADRSLLISDEHVASEALVPRLAALRTSTGSSPQAKRIAAIPLSRRGFTPNCWLAKTAGRWM